MTTRDLRGGLGGRLGRELAAGAHESALSDDAALGALFASSPARTVHTSAASETGFVAALCAIIAVPFSLMLGLATGLGAFALIAFVVGMAHSSRPAVAGSRLAAIGLVLSLATLAIVGLRYLGIDTAIGDSALTSLADGLANLNDVLPAP